MEFINPVMLWSALAVAVPIILHFWHQKKGKLLNWAAMTWLVEKNLQQSKGIKLENILLLLLRCLLLIFLAFFLSKPLLKALNSNGLAKKIHLVQANNLVVNNYKFELEDAKKRGEKIYWINSKTEQINDISKIPSSQEFNSLLLQNSINKIAKSSQNGELELYFVNNQDLIEASIIFIPNKFSLHTVIDSLNIPAKPYIEFSDKKKLFVNAANLLSSSFNLDANGKFEQKPIHLGAINILTKNPNNADKQAIEAALKALTQVYQIEMSVDFKKKSAKKYDLAPPAPDGGAKKDRFLEDGFFGGQLPEQIGEQIIEHFQLKPKQNILSQQQLNSIFKTSKNISKDSQESWFSKAILLLFIIILGIERWLAMKKNA